MLSYESLLREVRQLDVAARLRLIEALASDLRHTLPSTEQPLSILGLKGLGKEIWEGIDAQEYVNQERDSRDG